MVCKIYLLGYDYIFPFKSTKEKQDKNDIQRIKLLLLKSVNFHSPIKTCCQTTIKQCAIYILSAINK